MSKDKAKGTSVLARARLRHNNAGRTFGNGHLEFKGRVVKTAGKTQVYFGDVDEGMKKTR